ncbi:MAG: hypothetical protein ACWGIK_12050 [Achromobacter pulmonis]|uniref:Uncharacterized protein n=1 Tax=Achromobacter pulmonis TaxID=1389932 RepID=A0A6S7CV41_9BURK|nr:hypothetical protein [Achromobacter pulmonis]CAB3866031.1 hypothetical protein LMG26788_02520 [Achromobacter pulmonis]
MRIHAALLLCPLALALHTALARADTRVQSLDQVPGAIKTQDARRMYDSQMSGAPQPDGLGTQLPAGFTNAFLLQQLAPGRNPNRLLLAGAKAWPQRPGAYVALVCLAASAERAERLKQFGGGDCATLSRDQDNNEVWIGVFESVPGAAPRLLARTEAPVTTPTDWSDTDIDPPMGLTMQDAGAPMLATPESWKRFDLAPYRIAPGNTAFGLRAGWSEGYAGGGADFEALYLFHLDGAALRVVFAQPMAFVKSIAGDWNPDGTREHDESDASNSLVILPGKTAGYFDIQLRQQGGKWKRTFRWSAAKQAYE